MLTLFLILNIVAFCIFLAFIEDFSKYQNAFFALQIGKSKVFLRAGQMAELDARRAEVLGRAARSIQRQIRTHIARKEFLMLRKAAIHLQSRWRGISLSVKSDLIVRCLDILGLYLVKFEWAIFDLKVL